MGLLDDNAAVVTGGGKRPGKSFAMAMARESADVAIVGRDSGALSQAREEIRDADPGHIVNITTLGARESRSRPGIVSGHRIMT